MKTGLVTIEVSVIVPTYGRSALLKELLVSLFDQSLDPRLYEIIVIDDGSPDDTPQILATLEASAPCRFVWKRNPINRGPIYSRNIAARMALGAVLAFTDSDCRVSRGWLEAGLAAFQTDPELAFASGPVLDKPEQPIRFFSLPNGTRNTENPVCPTWNVFYRKSVFWDHNGFDETAWFGNVKDRPIDCSDSDFALKLKSMGHRSRFVSEALVYHEVWSVSPLDWLKAFFRLFYVPALIKRHPELRPQVLWWGPFLARENLLFYVAVSGLVPALFGFYWSSVLALPFLYGMAGLTARRLTVPGIGRMALQMVFLGLRQTVICSSLVYGSLRMRTLVL